MVSYLKLVKRIINKKGNNPVYLIQFVTSRCNARCDFCFYWKKLNKVKEELSLEEIDKLTKSFDKDLFHVILTGGEPFLRKDLADIAIAYHINAGAKNIAIVTTGFLTNKILQDVQKILETCPKLSLNVNLSINGLYEDMEKVTKLKNHFNKFLETYKGLVKLKRIYKNLGISALTTHSGLNQDKLGEIYDYIKKEMPEAVYLMNLIRGNPKNINLKNIDISKYEEIIEKMKEDRKSNNSTVAKLIAANTLLRDKIIAKTFKENRYLIPCYAASLIGVLYEQGSVFCCELLDKKMGDLRENNYDIKKVWNSSRAEEIRKHIKGSRCFCTHECFYTINVLFNLKFHPKLIKETMRFFPRP